jgi:hypothetical protein
MRFGKAVPDILEKRFFGTWINVVPPRLSSSTPTMA